MIKHDDQFIRWEEMRSWNDPEPEKLSPHSDGFRRIALTRLSQPTHPQDDDDHDDDLNTACLMMMITMNQIIIKL